jgi:hypothetical protein
VVDLPIGRGIVAAIEAREDADGQVFVPRLCGGGAGGDQAA